ncbi:MAG: DNA repair protein RecO [Phycisphaerales bacterium]|nr:DNA repair protein RecO [Phycisphaerales bacterium]
MAPREDEAVCVRHWDYSETSQTVTLFCRSIGLIRAIAKGSKRERSGFSGGVDILSRGNATIVIRDGNDLATVTGWSLIENFPTVRRTISANKIAYYAADLVGRLFESRDPHPTLYDGFVHFLANLTGAAADHAATLSNEQLLLDFQWLTLAQAGYTPRFGNASKEREGTTRDDDIMHFDPRDGGRVSHTATATSWRVRASTIATIETSQQGTGDLNHDSEALLRANRLLAAFIREIIAEEPFTMRQLFGEVIVRR